MEGASSIFELALNRILHLMVARPKIHGSKKELRSRQEFPRHSRQHYLSLARCLPCNNSSNPSSRSKRESGRSIHLLRGQAKGSKASAQRLMIREAQLERAVYLHLWPQVAITQRSGHGGLYPRPSCLINKRSR